MLVVWCMLRHISRKYQDIYRTQGHLRGIWKDEPILAIMIGLLTCILCWIIYITFRYVYQKDHDVNDTLIMVEEHDEEEDIKMVPLQDELIVTSAPMHQVKDIPLLSEHRKDVYSGEFQWEDNDDDDLWNRFQRVQLARKAMAEQDVSCEDWDMVESIPKSVQEKNTFHHVVSTKEQSVNLIGTDHEIFHRRNGSMATQYLKPSKKEHEGDRMTSEISSEKTYSKKELKSSNTSRILWEATEEGVDTINEEDFEVAPHQTLKMTEIMYDSRTEEEINRELDLIQPLPVIESSMMMVEHTKDGFSDDISGICMSSYSANTSVHYSEDETYDDLQLPEHGELKLRLREPTTPHEESLEEGDIMSDIDIGDEGFEIRLISKMKEIQGHRNALNRNGGYDFSKNMFPIEASSSLSHHETKEKEVASSDMPLFLKQLKQRNSEIVEEQELEHFGVDIPENIDLRHHPVGEFGDGTELDHLDDLSDYKEPIRKSITRSSIPKPPPISRKSSVPILTSPMVAPSSPSKIPLHRNSNLRSQSVFSYIYI
jgi:hypothetical protein